MLRVIVKKIIILAAVTALALASAAVSASAAVYKERLDFYKAYDVHFNKDLTSKIKEYTTSYYYKFGEPYGDINFKSYNCNSGEITLLHFTKKLHTIKFSDSETGYISILLYAYNTDSKGNVVNGVLEQYSQYIQMNLVSWGETFLGIESEFVTITPITTSLSTGAEKYSYYAVQFYINNEKYENYFKEYISHDSTVNLILPQNGTNTYYLYLSEFIIDFTPTNAAMSSISESTTLIVNSIETMQTIIKQAIDTGNDKLASKLQEQTDKLIIDDGEGNEEVESLRLVVDEMGELKEEIYSKLPPVVIQMDFGKIDVTYGSGFEVVQYILNSIIADHVYMVILFSLTIGTAIFILGRRVK